MFRELEHIAEAPRETGTESGEPHENKRTEKTQIQSHKTAGRTRYKLELP